MNNYMKERWKRRRAKAVDRLGGKCLDCGTIADLDFHHTDPQEKKFTIASGSSFSEERFWSEVDKCILLCIDCHTDRHRSNHPHGTVLRYWRGCRCLDCTAANTEYTREYRRQFGR